MKRKHSLHTGFGLIELIVVLMLVGILAAYAVMTSGAPGPLTLRSQAESLASHIRQTQSLSTANGKPMCLQVTSTTAYRRAEWASSACSTNPTSFLVERMVSISGPTLRFDTMGRPSASACYQLDATGSTVTPSNVRVDAVSGFVQIGDGACL